MDDARSPRTRRETPRQVVILVYPGVQSLDFAGPLEVFYGAQQLIEATGRRGRGYEVKLLSIDGRPL
jgi:transcriptional regulator GlxA family with amidase domain